MVGEYSDMMMRFRRESGLKPSVILGDVNHALKGVATCIGLLTVLCDHTDKRNTNLDLQVEAQHGTQETIGLQP
jgi:hypothetical protein